jgi:hypothetical protein
MTSTTGARPLTALDLQQCWGLLTRDTIGRIAYTYQGRPAVMPINYVVSGGDVLLRTDPGSVLAQAVDGQVVAFEVDRIDRATHSGWSVLAVGTAVTEDLTDQPPRPHLAGLEPWAEGARGLLIRIEVDAISGRRLLPPVPRPRTRRGLPFA